MKLRRTSLGVWMVVVAGAGIAACSSHGTSDPGERSQPASNSARLCKSSAEVSPRYDVVLASGTCSDVQASGGTWRARPLFPDAPTKIRDTYCSYQWNPAAGSETAPDPAPLRARGRVTPNCSAAQVACGASGSCPAATVTATPRLTGDAGTPASVAEDPEHTTGGGGANGCDVCVVDEESGDVYVVLPPEADDFDQLDISLDTGAEMSFSMMRSASVQSFVVHLPPPPPGHHYVPGSVRVR